MAARRAASAFNAELLALALRGLAPQPKAAPAPTAEPAKEPIILWGILFSVVPFWGPMEPVSDASHSLNFMMVGQATLGDLEYREF
jgi:hypothetical protein